MTDRESNSVCGMVAIIGRPNVGKSTYLNHSLGQKISITSRKPQTTRHQILGIKTKGNDQIVYVDTPGLQLNPKRALNRGMNKEVLRATSEVELILFLVEAGKWNEADEYALELVKNSGLKTILVINKIDKLDDRARLLPFIEKIVQRASDAPGNSLEFIEIIPVAARLGENIDVVEQSIIRLLPESEMFFPEDQITDRSVRFLAAELIREKLTRKLGDELPYHLSVTIEQFKEEANRVSIYAIIWVEREGQKRIVIGKKGAVLKAVGKEARLELQNMLEQNVFLQTWVKVKEKWSDNTRALQQFGLNS